MSRARIVKTAASLVALGSLIVVAIAGAAAWQGPVQVSAPGLNAGDTNHSPQISLGALGDATAGWFDSTGGVILARKLRGQGWSAPLTIGDPIPAPSSIYPGVDAAGNTTTSWTGVGNLAVVSDWPRTDSTAHSAPLPVSPFFVNDVKVNGDGVVVIAGTSGSDVVVAYRPANGVFQLHTFPAGGGAFTKPRLAINAAGSAAVIFRDVGGTGLWAATRTASADWGPSELVRTGVFDTVDTQPSVAIDGSGNVFAAYVLPGSAAGITVVHTALRPPGGGWQESPDLSANVAGFQANFASVVVNPSGTALLVWDEFTGVSNIQARYGSTGTGIWGPIEQVNDAGADSPVAAIGNDGRAVVAWERETVTGNIGQARVREPGPAGTFGDIRVLSLSHANVTHPSISTDGIGDFATVSSPFDGSAQRASVSAYDAAPPTLSDIVISGSQLAGDPVGLAVTPSDEWSAVGTPAWTFSDGGTASGTSVTHSLANAGSFTARVTVTDGSGNSASKDITVGVFSSQSSLTKAKFSAKWKVSRSTGTLLVEGAVPRAGNYTVNATLGKQRKMHTTLKLPAGKFSKKLKLPPKLLPGTYRIDLVPAASQVKPATQNAKLKAPPEGVVSRAFVNSRSGGPASRTFIRVHLVHANFVFAALPSGDVTVTWTRIQGNHVFDPVVKERLPTIVSDLEAKSGLLLEGKYRAVIALQRTKAVIATVTVTFKK